MTSILFIFLGSFLTFIATVLVEVFKKIERMEKEKNLNFFQNRNLRWSSKI